MAGTLEKDPFEELPPYDADNDSTAAFAAARGTANSDGEDGHTVTRNQRNVFDYMSYCWYKQGIYG
ncbi:Uu.00g099780.m01.CDS01 [Anthostomella pinea]|uniref:Uu.00g099780.m01.CDS01 n=1 Tax=Anthostomella pinea TaxID=933095 RepID=A0AAI8VCQ7_9PEZI|nr:Uu.00g099780.m01.CDS01 [Anthostomella pinea]